MLMATTEGLTLATTSAILGSTGASLSTGGDTQLESIWLVLLVGGELGGDEVSVADNAQLLLSIRTRIRIAEITRILTFFIANIIARQMLGNN